MPFTCIPRSDSIRLERPANPVFTQPKDLKSRIVISVIRTMSNRKTTSGNRAVSVIKVHALQKNDLYPDGCIGSTQIHAARRNTIHQINRLTRVSTCTVSG